MNPILFSLMVILIFLAGTGAGRTLERNGIFDKIRNKIFPPKSKTEFSIGIYTGQNPFEMVSYEKNPVLTKEDVTDRQAAYVADPFIVRTRGLWYMFFEVRNKGSYLTELAYAESLDGFKWEYQRVIQPDSYFQSYPHLFLWDGNFYMVAEGHRTNSIRIYKAKEFPEKWEYYSSVALGKDYVDPTIFRHDGKWWCFASTAKNEDLYLFYADDLKGPWKEHPLSPVVKKDKSSARPAGRVFEYNGDLHRVAQDCSKYYGEKVLAFKIIKLTTEEYLEEPVGVVLDKGEGWNSRGMHTFNPHATEEGWIAVVDGQK